MALVRWQPFRDVESLQRQMNRLFDQLMVPDDEGSITSSPMAFMPAAEMHETPDEIKLRIEVPGIEASDLDVNVSTEAVSISGDRVKR